MSWWNLYRNVQPEDVPDPCEVLGHIYNFDGVCFYCLDCPDWETLKTSFS